MAATQCPESSRIFVKRLIAPPRTGYSGPGTSQSGRENARGLENPPGLPLLPLGEHSRVAGTVQILVQDGARHRLRRDVRNAERQALWRQFRLVLYRQLYREGWRDFLRDEDVAAQSRSRLRADVPG